MLLYSLFNIIGVVLVGRLPKQSPYHWNKDTTDIIDKDYWFNNDLSYEWISRNETLKRYNNKLMVESVNDILEDYRYNNIRHEDKKRLVVDIINVVEKYNRVII